jgi:1,2-diacylglycerol 3-alpha-glucosyltransferase
MNIVFATDQYWPSISGVSVSIDSFKREFENLGHTVFLLVPDYPDAPEYDKKHNTGNVLRFRSYKVFFNDENRLIHASEKKNVYMALNSIKPDIIHTHTEFTLCKIARQYARKHQIPLVMTAHTNWEELIHLYVPFFPTILARLYCRHRLRKTYNKANAVVVPTSLMELLLNLYFVKTHIRVIPTGIHKNEIENLSDSEKHHEILESYPGLKGHKILLFVGRIGKEKNIPFLFDVVENLLQEHTNIKLVICGDGPARKELEEVVLDRQLESHIIFTGFIERNQLKHFYALADIFVFASKVESQGLVSLEAMSYGTPVVAIGKMGTREVMGGDNGGYMVDDDLEMFVEKVLLLLNQPEIYKQKTKEALHHVKKWTMQIESEKMLRLYHSLCRNHKKTCLKMTAERSAYIS